MQADKIQANRIKLARFLESDTHRLQLEIDSSPAERIRFIYACIFPGGQKYRFYWRFALARLAQSIDYSPIKVALYRFIGMKIGKGVFISPGVVLDPHFPSLIEIGDYTIIGWGTHLFTHEYSGHSYLLGRIRIGSGAIIGGMSVVRAGVCIGDNAEVASTSIVYKDVPHNHCLESEIHLTRTLFNLQRKPPHG